MNENSLLRLARSGLSLRRRENVVKGWRGSATRSPIFSDRCRTINELCHGGNRYIHRCFETGRRGFFEARLL